jgi:N-formylglutamate deformylase
MVPVVVHVPHSSTFVPSDMRDSFSLLEAELKREILRLTDWYIDELFSSVKELGGAAVLYPLSRLVVDPERFEDDAQEIMASKGIGVIYTRTSDGRELRAAPSEGERRALLDQFYRPHHRVLEQATETCLIRFGKCLILDCHSFASKPLPFELDQDPVRPDICLGTDPFHTPPALTDSIEEFFAAPGLRVYREKPYKGTLVPMKFYGKDQQVSSIMIELNRKLYMDENTGEKLSRFPEIQAAVEQLLGQLITDRDFC